MKKFIKKALVLTCILSLQMIKPATILHASPRTLTYDGKQHIYDKPPITLEVNNKKIDMEMPPVQIGGRTLVPTRGVFEPMGALVEWKEVEKKAYVNYENKLIVLEVNSGNAWVEGKMEKLDAPPKIINNTLMLPIRFIGETLDFVVDWNDDSRHIKINQPTTTSPIQPEENPEDKPVAPKHITEAREVKVRNENDGTSTYIIHLKEPLKSYSHFTQTGKVVVDIDNTKNSLQSNFTLGENPYVERVRTSQFTPETTRVVFDLKREGKVKVDLSPSKKEINISIKGDKPVPPVNPENVGRDNLRYTNSPREALVLKKAPGMTTNNIKINNDYRNLKTTITLPGNHSNLYKNQTLNIASSTIDRIVVATSGGNTQITIFEKKIRAYEIVNDGDDIKILFMQPRERYDKIVVLDFGHGGSDPGASANGLVEKNLNFEQGMHAYRLLENDPNIKVYITRDNDTYPSNPSRAKLANDIGADLFISFHNNSVTGIPTANGTEVLYSTKDPKSKQAAEIIQRNMVKNLGTNNRGTKPRPGLIVLNQTNMPAVLIETGFVTNSGDAAKLKSAEFNKKVGQTVYDSTVEIFNTISFR